MNKEQLHFLINEEELKQDEKIFFKENNKLLTEEEFWNNDAAISTFNYFYEEYIERWELACNNKLEFPLPWEIENKIPNIENKEGYAIFPPDLSMYYSYAYKKQVIPLLEENGLTVYTNNQNCSFHDPLPCSYLIENATENPISVFTAKQEGDAWQYAMNLANEANFWRR